MVVVLLLLLLLLVVVLVVRVEGVDEGESIVDEGSGVLLAITPAGGAGAVTRDATRSYSLSGTLREGRGARLVKASDRE